MVGKRGGKEAVVLSLLEKKTETYLAYRIPAMNSESIMDAMNAIHNEYAEHFANVFKTITVDNGGEFADLVQIEKWGCQVYFAHPYTSREQPQNKHRNGLFRGFVHKSVSIEQYADENILATADELNRRPQKKFSYHTQRNCLKHSLTLFSQPDGCGNLSHGGYLRPQP